MISEDLRLDLFVGDFDRASAGSVQRQSVSGNDIDSGQRTIPGRSHKIRTDNRREFVRGRSDHSRTRIQTGQRIGNEDATGIGEHDVVIRRVRSNGGRSGSHVVRRTGRIIELDGRRVRGRADEQDILDDILATGQKVSRRRSRIRSRENLFSRLHGKGQRKHRQRNSENLGEGLEGIEQSFHIS